MRLLLCELSAAKQATLCILLNHLWAKVYAPPDVCKAILFGSLGKGISPFVIFFVK